jgi:hypothetical protein
LYSHFYICGTALPTKLEDDHLQQTGLTPFVAELSAANSGTGFWEEGWRVRTVENGTIAVTRGGLAVWARPQECMVAEGRPIGPGTSVRLRFPKEFLDMSPGFYVALGDKPLSVDDGQAVVRVYWNLTAEGAASFVRIATTALNGASLPFRLKVLRDPLLFTRCDAAVVYLLRSDFRVAVAIFRKVHAETLGLLRPATPVFAKPLAWGVGLAEDPGSGESFGQNRCRLVADAAIRAYERGKKSVDDQLEVVSERFAEDGTSLATPFLNAGSKDAYPRLVQSSPLVGMIRTATKAPGGNFGAETLLRTADELGQRLVREAVWQGDQCNWLGVAPTGRGGEGGVGSTYSALGPDLYAGTSGVALFLAELYAATGATEARRAALGAVQQALAHCDALLAKSRLGFYAGDLGIVFSAARVGSILGEQELVERAARLLQECTREWQAEREYDLISGDAGAIIALLVLRELLHDGGLLDLARRLGDGLLQSADRSQGSYSWKSHSFRYRHNLTGLSHGTAGVGLALLELFHATGDVQYRAAAEGAFEYERSWFNPQKGNWPDFREGGTRGKLRFDLLNFSTFWCHGAPGIGLTRLRAYEILNDTTCKYEASVATNTTYEMIKTALHEGNANFSLCHGLAGNAELLLYARRLLGEEWTQKSSLAFEVAEAGIEASKRKKGAWSCGVSQGETPSLLLGLAGIGYFYLRLYNPAIPSILMLRREDFV